jgi:hypothetical protein
MRFNTKTKVTITIDTQFATQLPKFEEKNDYKDKIKEQALNALKDYFLGNNLNDNIVSLNIKTTIKGED